MSEQEQTPEHPTQPEPQAVELPSLDWRALPDADFAIVGSPPQVTALLAAFAQAQGEFPEIPKTRTVRITSQKGNYSFEYAPLETIHKAVRPVLARYGLGVMQPVAEGLQDAELRTILAHRDGAMMITRHRFLRGNDIKDFGAQQTYRRRYAESALLNIAADADADDTPTRPEETDADAGPRSKPCRARAPKASPAPQAREEHAPVASPTDDGYRKPAEPPQAPAKPPSVPPPAPQPTLHTEPVTREQSEEIRNHGRRLGWSQPQLVQHLMAVAGVPAAKLDYISAEKWLEKLRTEKAGES